MKKDDDVQVEFEVKAQTPYTAEEVDQNLEKILYDAALKSGLSEDQARNEILLARPQNLPGVDPETLRLIIQFSSAIAVPIIKEIINNFNKHAHEYGPTAIVMVKANGQVYQIPLEKGGSVSIEVIDAQPGKEKSSVKAK